MKRFILISILFFTLFGCAGTRSVDKNKSVEKSSGKTESVKQTETSVNQSGSSETAKVTESKSAENEKVSTMEKKIETEEQSSDKNNSESAKKTFKNTEYYENGQKKSETEYSEDTAKLSTERDYYKSSAEALKESLKSSEKKLDEAVNENNRTQYLLQYTQNSYDQLNQEYSDYKLLKSNKTEREFLNLWWLWLTIGIVAGKFGWDIVKFFWQKAKASQWYLTLIERLNKKR